MKEERELIKSAQNGDSESFGELYDKYVTRIYRFIFLRVRQKTDAEDLSQKVFLKAWKNIDSYRDQKGASFSSWLYKIAKNTIIDYYRTNKEHADIDSVPEDELDPELPSYMEEMDDSFKLKQIKAALGELTDNQQNVIIMKFIEELSNEEISDALDKTEVAVRVTQHRALKRIKQILNEEDHNKK